MEDSSTLVGMTVVKDSGLKLLNIDGWGYCVKVTGVCQRGYIATGAKG